MYMYGCVYIYIYMNIIYIYMCVCVCVRECESKCINMSIAGKHSVLHGVLNLNRESGDSNLDSKSSEIHIPRHVAWPLRY